MTETAPKTVLYIEDDAAYVLLVKRALQRSKLDTLPHLEVVGSVEDAFRYLQGQDPYNNRATHPLPSLVITDLRLPGKSGLQLVKWVREQSQLASLPIVMLTGSAVDEDIKHAYELGIDFCLVKPTEVDVLVSVIQALS
ncbi:MAG TPA: response regulator, partial [Leptolyngbyaceae cyanobacterium]